MSDLVRRLDGEPAPYVSLAAAEAAGLTGLARAPRSTKILIESILRAGVDAGAAGEAAALERAGAVLRHATGDGPPVALDFMPLRVVLQDHSGVPALLDLANLRSQLTERGGRQAALDLRLPVHLVIDHSVEAHVTGRPDSLEANMRREADLNAERFAFLRWARGAFSGLQVVPPGRGIIHHINLEHLAEVVGVDRSGRLAPDTVLGTDSHTPMVNGLGVLGWGVGGIEATSVMVGEPVSMLSPEVVGVELVGRAPQGILATDVALTLTARLRAEGVVAAHVEFFGAGMASLSAPDRATIANMAPEYGSTVAFFPVDRNTLDYLRQTGREPAAVARTERYLAAQGLLASDEPPAFRRTIRFDLADVRPSMAGPEAPRQLLALGEVPRSWAVTAAGPEPVEGAVAIAAITSCTNTANPRAVIAAAIVAERAAARGLRPPQWVKTSFSPGSRSVSRYLEAAGLMTGLRQLGFDVAGYGCMTCIGNSGDLTPAMGRLVESGARPVAVLSGNRNFPGRIHPQVSGAYLASPPLVVAYALAGSILVDVDTQPLGRDSEGHPVFLRDLQPSEDELTAHVAAIGADVYRAERETLFAAARDGWPEARPTSAPYRWPTDSNYIVRPPPIAERGSFADGLAGCRMLLLLGDGVTTDHISPAGAIEPRSAAGAYLLARGVAPEAFNTFGCRRGNHDVMVRGAFSNPALRNRLADDLPGGWTLTLPEATRRPMHEAAEIYRQRGVPLVVVAGDQYGMGSSRDWAAKGQALLGIRAVLAGGFERIHRSNLIGVGIAPLEFLPGDDSVTLALSGRETLNLRGLQSAGPGGLVTVAAHDDSGAPVRQWTMRLRVETEGELRCLRAGGFLPSVLQRSLEADPAVSDSPALAAV